MRKISIIIIFLFSIVCFSCQKKTCPAFPAELNYFPYFKGQEVLFYNSDDTLRFVIKNIAKSEASTLDCTCDCTIVSRCDIYCKERHFYGDISFTGSEKIYKIDVGFFLAGSETITKTLYEGKAIPIKEAGKYCSDTIFLEKEKNIGIKKIVIVKNKGLVSYTTGDGEEWKLVECSKTISSKIIKN